MKIIAPGTYCPEKVKLDLTPQYSFGFKVEQLEKNDIPGLFKIPVRRITFILDINPILYS